MVGPGLLAIFAPTAVGIIFRLVGQTGMEPDRMAGARAVCSFLMFATVTGVVMGLFLNNTGGAWDNAKKLVETGLHGEYNAPARMLVCECDFFERPPSAFPFPSFQRTSN